MDSRLVKGLLYIILLVLVLSFCSGCDGGETAVYNSEIYVSKTAEEVPIFIYTIEPPGANLDRDIIDNALDDRISEHRISELAENCQKIAIDLERYFGFTSLELGVERQYTHQLSWPENKRCRIVRDRPGI